MHKFGVVVDHGRLAYLMFCTFYLNCLISQIGLEEHVQCSYLFCQIRGIKAKEAIPILRNISTLPLGRQPQPCFSVSMSVSWDVVALWVLILVFRLQDNVFVQLLCSIQYRIVRANADDAFYELQNPKEQIQAYVFDGIFLYYFSRL